MWNLNQFDNNTAIIEENGSKVTYAELQAACEELAKSASGRPLVFCLCTNEKGSLLGYVMFINNKEELKTFFADYRPKGIDRAVPIGKSMDFSLIWDGYDLIREMSRKITVI